MRLAPLIATIVAALALAAQNPPAGPQNPPAGQGAAGAPKPDVRANPQSASPSKQVSSTSASSTPAPSVTPSGAQTAQPTKPRLRVEWRGGSLYVVAQRERLSTVLSEIARRTGIKVEGAEQLQELVSVELTKVPLEQALERLLARDDYAIQKNAGPDGAVRLRVVILRAAPDGSGLVAGAEPAGGPAPSAPIPRPPDLAARLVQAPGGAPASGAEAVREESPAQRLQKLQQLAKSDQDDRVVLSALGKALDDDDDGVRDFAIQALVSRGSPEAIGYLRDVLHDPDPSARLALVESLGEKEEGRAILEEALSDSDESVRSEAANLLKQGDSSTPK